MTTPARRGDLYDPLCPTRGLLDRVGDKWTAMLVKVLAEAPDGVRFGDLRRRVPGISTKMLSETLRRLGSDGLVSREVLDTTPPGVRYRVTPLGRSLDGALAALRDWAEEHMVEVDEHRAGRPTPS